MHFIFQPIIKKVFQTGNSLTVIVPAKFAKHLGIHAGDAVDVKLDYDNGQITYTFLSIRQPHLI